MCLFSAGTRQFQTICVLSLKGGQENFFIIFISELHGNYCERPRVNSRELVGAEKSSCQLPASETENLLLRRWRVGRAIRRLEVKKKKLTVKAEIIAQVCLRNAEIRRSGSTTQVACKEGFQRKLNRSFRGTRRMKL